MSTYPRKLPSRYKVLVNSIFLNLSVIYLTLPAIAQLPRSQQSQDSEKPATIDNIVVSTRDSDALNNDAYVIAGGDRIQIDILDLPTYSGVYQIPIDGIIDLPLINSISLRGLTLVQAKQKLHQAYSKVLNYPVITINLVSPSPINVVVAGEVNNPGSFTIDLVGGVGNAPGLQYPTLTGALKQAGGITLSADIEDIQIRRSTLDQNQEQVITVNLQELVETNNPNSNITLRNGDRVFVPTNTEVNLKEIWQLARADFAADPNTGRTVAVVGEVWNPGSYQIQLARLGEASAGLPTISFAIKEAGGIRPFADLRNIKLRRQTKTGVEQIISLDLWQLLEDGDISQDTILQDGDTIIIPKNSEISNAQATQLAHVSFAPEMIQVSVVGEVKSPGLLNLPPSTPLNQALLSAGGFNGSRAKINRVQLLRLNFDGTVVSREIEVDLNRPINEENNPLLQNHDIIVVNRSTLARFSDTTNLLLSPAQDLLSLFNIPLRTLEILERLGVRVE